MRYVPAMIAALPALMLGACGPTSGTPVASSTPAETASPAPSQAAGAQDVTLPLGPHGYGGLLIGASLAEVTAKLGPDAKPNAVGGPDEEACNEFRPKNAPDGMMVMMIDGKLARISLVELSKVKTAAGIGLGATAATVTSAYGDRAQVTPHKYQDKPAEYITVWNDGPRKEPYVEDKAARGVVYEIDGTGKVGAIHAGGPSIQYVEGCS